MSTILTAQQHRKALARATADMDTQQELVFLRGFVVKLEEQVDWLLKENIQLRAALAKLDVFVHEPSPSAMARH